MRVVTFNIHHGTVAKSGPVDVGRLAEVCAGFDADVVALQEVDQGTWRVGGSDLAAEVARRCAMDHVFGASRWFPGGRYGNAVLARGQVEAWAVSRLPRVPSWKFWQESRTLLQAQIRVAGQALSVAVTHLAVPQSVNAVQLDAVLDLTGRRPRPLVVMGDLNRFPSTVRPAAAAAGLTYVAHGTTCLMPPLIIDHVLVSPDLTVARVEVRPTEMSDHAALIVDLELAVVEDGGFGASG